MSQSTINEERHTLSAKRRYVSNATRTILEILWRHTYSGHGLSTTQIHDLLLSSFGDDAPAIRTVRNQLNALEGSEFLGREIHKLDPRSNDDDANEMDGAIAPQAGWRMSTFFDTAEARLLTDSLALSRISRDTMSGVIEKLGELVGGISLNNDYLTVTNAKDSFNGDFLHTIGILNEAVAHHQSVTFNYTNYDHRGRLKARKAPTGQAREYHVDPYQMVFKNGRYYLVCLLHTEASEQRIFCIDRIINPQLSEPSATSGTDFDAITYMRERPYPVTDEVTDIAMLVQPPAFNAVFEWFDNPTILGPDTNGWYRVTARSPVKAACWWTLQYAAFPIRILGPKELRQQLAESLHTLIIHYNFNSSNNGPGKP